MQVSSSYPVQFSGKTKDGRRLQEAIKQGDTETAKKLLAKGVDPLNAPTTIFPDLLDSIFHPFLAALRRSNFTLAQYMVDKCNVDPSRPMVQKWHRDSTPETSLLDEALLMSPEALAFVLKEGADPNQKSQLAWAKDKTPVEALVFGPNPDSEESIEKLALLLEHGAKDDVPALLGKLQSEVSHHRWINQHREIIAFLKKWLAGQKN